MTTAAAAPRAPGHDAAPPRIAYVMSRFPRLTETFILSELLALEAAGVDVAIYPLLREEAALVQPGAADLVRRARYLPFVSPAMRC